MGKKDSGAAKAQAKAAKRAKQEAKASKTADKAAQKAKARAAPPPAAASKGGKSGKGGKGKKAPVADEEDLDALLASFREQWAAEHAVHEERIGTAPSRRANATLTPCPGGDDLWLFGGEYFDGDRATFFADLFRYTPAASPAEQGVWRSYSSANQPGPRSAHAIAPFPGNGGQLFLFGGEFASPKMNSFHHYRDLWIFTIATKSWERIDTKVRPSARSGHRMVCWKQYIILFGGFQDTGQRTTYLGDLWIFDTTEYKWHEVKQNELRKPAARSGFSLLPSADGVILHGGYCKRYLKGQRTQGVALEDTWMLTIDAGPDGELFKTGKIEWQRRRKIGYAPGPRSGCTMALWGTKGMGALFGGVTDTEADEESMDSICHADMFAYQLGGNGRWISLNLKRPKKKGGRRRKKVVAQPEQRKGPQSDDEDEGSGGESGDEEADRSRPDAQSAPAPALAPAPAPEEDDDPDDPQKSVPIGRYNTMLAIQRNILYLYGGIHETAAREYTMDDFYTLDLLKLERFHCLKDCPTDALEWNESDESDDDSDDDDSDDSSSDGDEPAEQEGEEMREADLLEELEWLGDEGMSDEAIAAAKQALLEKEELRKKAKVFMGVALDSTRSEADMLSTPLPGETLRVFYERSKAYWVGAAHEQGDQSNRGKELRRDGFAMAEKRYDEYKPMLQEIERIQAEAGLDAEDMRAAAGKTGGIAGGGAGADSRNRR